MSNAKMAERPYPEPQVSVYDPENWFTPAPEVVNWIHQVLLTEGGHLYNEDHKHLLQAELAVLWAWPDNSKKGRRVIGEAEIPMFRCGKWQKARQEQQMIQWFGSMPDFLITLDAHYCSSASDVEFAALVEHELYHCAQDVDEFGSPKFKRSTGEPVFVIRGHDVEEFVGVVRRYGVGERDEPMKALVQAAKGCPEVAKVDVARACGTCSVRAV